jgi:hypothetical protein
MKTDAEAVEAERHISTQIVAAEQRIEELKQEMQRLWGELRDFRETRRQLREQLGLLEMVTLTLRGRGVPPTVMVQHGERDSLDRWVWAVLLTEADAGSYPVAYLKWSGDTSLLGIKHVLHGNTWRPWKDMSSAEQQAWRQLQVQKAFAKKAAEK